ncbi:MAG: DUF4271 domain-containing protein [Bacteroidota bacterium]|jgi:hypothetical protein
MSLLMLLGLIDLSSVLSPEPHADNSIAAKMMELLFIRFFFAKIVNALVLNTVRYLCVMPSPNLGDSIKSNADTNPDSVLSEVVFGSLIEGHLLQVNTLNEKAIEPRNPDWFSISLFILMAWFTWMRVVYSKLFVQLLGAIFNMNTTNQLVRDENILIQRASVMLSLMFYCSFALFIFQALDRFEMNIPWIGFGLFRFLFILMAIALAYSLKTILLKLLGNVFDIEKPAASYIFNFTLINISTGIALLPIILILAFVDSNYVLPFYYTGFGILIISFIYRQIRALRIWSSMQGVSFFYFIVYICTLEISPFLILYKIIMG